MSRSGSVDSSVSSWAMTSLAEASSICTPRKMIRSSKSLLYGLLSFMRSSSAPRRRGGCSGWRAAGNRSWSSGPRCSVVGDRVGAVGHGGLADDVVDEAVLEGLGRGEPPVAVGVLLDLLDRLPGVLRLELVELLLGAAEQVRLDGDVGRGAADAGRGLVH